MKIKNLPGALRAALCLLPLGPLPALAVPTITQQPQNIAVPVTDYHPNDTPRYDTQVEAWPDYYVAADTDMETTGVHCRDSVARQAKTTQRQSCGTDRFFSIPVDGYSSALRVSCCAGIQGVLWGLRQDKQTRSSTKRERN